MHAKLTMVAVLILLCALKQVLVESHAHAITVTKAMASHAQLATCVASSMGTAARMPLASLVPLSKRLQMSALVLERSFLPAKCAAAVTWATKVMVLHVR